MKIIGFVSSLVRPVRFLVVAFTCVLLLLTNAFPALAIDTTKSAPTEGTVQLNEIQLKTDEKATEAPLGLEETQAETYQGLNEVQGDADFDKMKRPENSQNATTVKDQVENFLEKVTGNK
jgi:hypothetical protein